MSRPKQTALIVDDESSIRNILSAQLEELGYECVAVSGGEEALDKVARHQFDLMMLDVKMPGMSGLEVLTRFRDDHLETCVVMLSGPVDATIASEAMKHGADDYVTKPCDLDYLSMRLRRAHERRDLAKQQGPDQSPSGETAPKQVNPHEITEDLVNQQVARYQRLASAPDAGDEDPKRRR